MPRSFIVIEANPITNMDLVSLIQGSFPRSSITTTQAVRDAAPRAAAGQNKLTVLINSSLMTDTARDLLQSMVVQGTKVILLGKDVMTDFPKKVVETPFTSNMILAALNVDSADPLLPLPEGRVERPER